MDRTSKPKTSWPFRSAEGYLTRRPSAFKHLAYGQFGSLYTKTPRIGFQDDANLNDPLGGYWTVDLHTSYDITPRIQIFGLINNVFDEDYGVFGTFFNLEAANSGASADPQLGGDFFTNPRTITPGPPVVAYGGVKVKLW